MTWLRWVPAVICAGVCVGALSGCGGGKAKPALTISISPSAAQNVDQGQKLAFTVTVTNDLTNAGVTWSLSGTNCSGNNCGTLSNTTTTATTYTAPKGLTTPLTVTLKAASVANTNDTATVSINVVLALSFTTTSVPNGVNGTPYNQTIQVTGGVSPLTFSLRSGPLPSGLFLNSGGTITGRPTGSGTSNTFTIQVADSGNPPITASESLAIAIAPPPPLAISTTPLPNGQVSSPYNASPSLSSGGVPPLTWIIVSGTGPLPSGLSLSSTTGQISGTPTSVGTSKPFSVQAQDSAIPSQTATQSFSITITPPPPLSITTASLPEGTTATAYSASLEASGGLAPITWSVINGQLPGGLSLDPASGLISGTPVRQETATFTVQATDSETTPEKASKQFSITIVPNGTSTNNNTLLNGAYVFLFEGFSSVGTTLIAGQFTANGGATGDLTSGTEDINFVTVQKVSTNVTFTGTYAIDANGRGSMTFNVSGNSNTTAASTYLLTLDSDGNGRFIESDSSGLRGTGILKKQSSTSFAAASLIGNYAFELAGFDASKKRSVIVGTISADGNSSLSGGELDSNDAGSTNLVPGVNGSYSVSGNGRGTASVFLGGMTQLNFVIYVVSSTDVFFISSDTLTPTTPPAAPAPPFVTSGEAFLEQTVVPGGGFDVTSLSGASVVSGTGLDGSSATVLAGLLAADGTGRDSLIFDQNDHGSITPAGAAQTGTYSVSSNGRVRFTGLGSRMAVGYLVSPNRAFVIGSDSAATSGLLEEQLSGPFNSGSLEGSYVVGAGFPAESQVGGLEGVVDANGISKIAGVVDVVSGSGTSRPGQTVVATYTIASNGRGTITVSAPSGVPTPLIFYIVSASQARIVSADSSDSHPAVLFFDH
ncbi:MAG: Ig domain-containing protein [Candidatus Acidiferrales bacterium]